MNYLDTINAFVREQLYPLEPLLLQDGFEAVAPRLEALRQEVKALGLWAPHLPPDFGGMDLPLREFAQVSEALGRSPLGHYTFNCAAPGHRQHGAAPCARHGQRSRNAGCARWPPARSAVASP